jgi:copper chaperone CopZ
MKAHMMLMSVTAEEIHGDGIGMINGKMSVITAMIKYLLMLLFCFPVALRADVFDPDIEIGVKGLVCSSCGIGIKKGFAKTKLVKLLKLDINRQKVLVQYFSIEIHPSKIKQIVKKAGYEVSSIKWLKKKEPNRYNKP